MEEFQLSSFDFDIAANQYVVRQKTFGNFSKDLQNGMTLFAIVNIFWSTAIVIEFLLTGKHSIDPILFNFDTGFLTLITYYYEGFQNVTVVVLVTLGWIAASFYAKLRYGPKANLSILYGILILPMLSIIAFLIIFLPILFNTVVGIAFYLLMQQVIVTILWFSVLVIPGFVLVNILISDKQAETAISLIPDFLVLKSPPKENKEACPFKNLDPNGCSFLGYRATEELPLICDFKSTYTLFNIYKHLYEKVEFEGAKNK